GSAIAGGPENLTAFVSRAGTYNYRAYGWLAADTPFTITSTQTMAAPPTLAPIGADWVDGSNNRYDFDGSFSLSWNSLPEATSYEVEGTTDGTHWNVVQTAPAGATGVAFSNLGDGNYGFRVRAIESGRIGK